MKSKKQVKAEMLVHAQDQLKDREEAAKIIHEELISQLEGSGFWSELQELVAQSKPSVHVMAKFNSPSKGKKKEAVIEIPQDEFVKEHENLVKELSKHNDTKKEAKAQATELKAVKGKRKNNKMKERGLMVRKIMAERGVSLAEASKIIKQEGLI